jgi:hypothetical protein
VSLFWSEDEEFVATAGARFEILEPINGMIYRYTETEPTGSESDPVANWFKVEGAGYWVEPTGPDEVRDGVTTPVDWKRDPHLNGKPDVVKRYGTA